MKKLLLLIIFIFGYHMAFSDHCELTVIAKSGLSLRKEPNLQSQKLAVAKFGDIVIGDWVGEYEGQCDYSSEKFTQNLIKIEGRNGFWMQVKYKNLTGYMFSGFLVIGNVFVFPKLDLCDNVIIDQIVRYDEGDSPVLSEELDFTKYSPFLNWYGIDIRKNGVTIISEVNLVLEINNDRWSEKRWKPNWTGDIKLRVDRDKKFDFIYGSKTELSVGIVDSKLYLGKLVDRNLFFEMIPHKNYYYFKKNKYKIKQLPNYDKSYSEKVFQDIVSMNSFYDRLNYEPKGDQYPTKWFWAGDINRDGYLEFFFQVNYYEGKCGAVPYIIFFASKKKLGKVQYESYGDSYYNFNDFNKAQFD